MVRIVDSLANWSLNLLNSFVEHSFAPQCITYFWLSNVAPRCVTNFWLSNIASLRIKKREKNNYTTDYILINNANELKLRTKSTFGI